MAGFFDPGAFKWSDPSAVQLWRTLADFFPDQREVRRLSGQANIPAGAIAWGNSAYDTWTDILDEAARRGELRRLVEAAAAEVVESPSGLVLRALLDGQPPPVDAGSASRSASAFIGSDPALSEPEALLFKDDLTLDMGRVPWLIGVLQKLVTLAPAVCKLTAYGTKGALDGTGFLIGERLVLTNHHVTHVEGAAAGRIVARFGYQDDGTGSISAKDIEGRCDTIQGDDRFDWSVFTLAGDPPATAPLRLSDPGAPQREREAFIIQHPLGQPKRIAYARNRIVNVDEICVHYLSDTQSASSGSPVFDGDGRLIALHRAGGVPTAVTGRDPIRKNEGVRVGPIVKGLQTLGIVFA